MNSIKTIFMGTPDFSCVIADALVKNGFEIIAVVTQPDKEAGRGKKIRFSPVKDWAIVNGIEVLQPEKVRDDEFVQKMVDLKPELVVTAAFGQIIPKSIIDMPKYGCINVHASLLPEYRGASPIQQSLFDGCTETGITLQYMNEKMDEGDIIIQKALTIENDDNAGTLFEKLAVLGANVIDEYALLLANGKPQGIPQNHEKATYCRKIEKEKGNIDWAMSAKDIFNIIRAMTPAPGAYSFLNGKRIKIYKADYEETNTEKPVGTIVSFDKITIKVQTGNGVLAIKELQPEGKSVQLVRDFVNGNKLTADMAFERNI